ncbi:hypothetical protein EDD15DRAFT_2200420 [Pisolithus albus]|nr:hypothetical protein EDD15DRAFT_2200420 [Pisolithus albus]
MKHPPAVIIPTPKRTSSYAIPPARRAEASGSTPVRASISKRHTNPGPCTVRPPTLQNGYLLRLPHPASPELLMHRAINDLERRILTLDTRTPAPTPGLADDRIQFQWTVATLTREIEALRLKVEGAIPPNPAASTSMPTIPMEPEVAAIDRTEEVTAASFPPPPPDDYQRPTSNRLPSQKGETVNVTMGDPATEMDVCPSITQGAQSEAGDGNAASESGPGDVVAAADDHREGNSGMSQIADMDVADSS